MADHASRVHAKLSASGAHRWIACPGSVSLIEQTPSSRRSSSYADRGTALHQVVQDALEEHIEPEEGREINVGRSIYEVQESDLDGLNIYIDYVNALVNRSIFCETEFSLKALEQIHPSMGGTADFIAVDTEGVLTIVDFKSGRGVMVSPVENPQLIIYGLGVWTGLARHLRAMVKVLRLVIIQPYGPIEPFVKEWELEPADAMGWINKLQDAAKATEDPAAPLVPGDHCRWCDAYSSCPAVMGSFLEVSEMKSSVPAPLSFSPQELGSILVRFEQIKPWIDEIYKLALAAAEQGVPVPGMKLVPKRSNRKWDDPEFAASAIKQLGKDPYTKKIVSPAQAKKLLGKAAFAPLASLVVKLENGNNLVPDADKVKGPDLTPVLPSPSSLGM